MNYHGKTAMQLGAELEELQQKYDSVFVAYEKEKLEHRQTISDIEVLYSRIETGKAKLETALESMNDAVFVSDTEGNFIDFNEAFATFHKFKNKNECAKTLKEFPLFLDVYKSDGSLASIDEWAVPRALRGETASNQEYTLHRKDTGEKWVGSFSLAPIRDKDGQIIGSVVTGRDITIQKQSQEKVKELAVILEFKEEERTRQLSEVNQKLSEEIEIHKQTGVALSESQANLSALCNSTDELIYLISADLILIELNEIAVKHANQPADLLKGKNIFDILPLENAEFHLSFIHRSIATCKPVFYEDKRNDKWMINRIYPILDKSGKVNRLAIFSRDITNQKQAEEIALNSQLAYRTLADNSLDSVIRFDRKFRHLYINRVAAAIVGMTPEEVTGKTNREIGIPDEVATIWEDRFRCVFESGESLNVEDSFPTITGKRIYGIRCVAEQSLDGIIQSVLVISRDITEQKRVEEALQKSEEKYRKFFEEDLTGDFIANGMGIILDCNPAFLNIFGFTSKEEIVGESIALLHPDASEYNFFLLELEKHKTIKGFEAIRKRKNGELIHIIENRTAIFNDVGEIIEIKGFIYDITERKLAEQALMESEARFKDLFQRHNSIMLIIDPELGKIEDANQAAIDFYGYSITELLSLNIADINTLPVDEIKKEYQKAYKEERNYFVFPHRLANGTKRIVEVHSTPINVPNKKVLFSIIHDITERMQAEAQLRDTSLYNRSLIEASIDPLVTIGYNGCIMDVNKATEQITGVNRESLIGTEFSDYFTEPEKAKNGYLQVLETGQVTDYPLSIRHVDNKISDVLYNATIYRNSEGNIAGVFAAARDITERKLVEAALQESEEKYRSIFTTERDSILIIDEQTFEILDFNNAACELYGYSRDEMLRLKSYDLSAEPEKTKKAMRNLYDWNEFRYHVKKDGSVFPVHISAGHFTLKGKLLLLAAIRDISVIKQTELALQTSNDRYEKLASSIPVGVYIMHSKPDGTFALEYISTRMAGMLGLSVESLQNDGTLIVKSIHPDDKDSFLNLISTGLHMTLQPLDWKGRFVVNGEVKWLHLLSTPELLENGDILRHGLIVDITESMLADAEIRNKNEALSKALSEKDKFFSIIAHDLRGPLSNSLELMKIMSENLMSMPLNEINKIIDVVKSSSTNLFSLLENLLEWSRTQRGMTVFEPTSFLLLNKFNECLVLPLEMAFKKEIEVSMNITDGTYGYTDQYMFTSIVRNLVSNAVKFTPRGGKIYIGARYSTTDNQLVISVKDTGIGMSKTMIESLFRLDINNGRKGTEGENSTGLGLIICKDFVEKMGGKLLIESEEGKGSSFSFSIPSKL